MGPGDGPAKRAQEEKGGGAQHQTQGQGIIKNGDDETRGPFLEDNAALASEVGVEAERGSPGRKEVHREILHQRDEEEITRSDPFPEKEPVTGGPDDRPEEGEDSVETRRPEGNGGKGLPQLVPARLAEKKEQNNGCYDEGQNDSKQAFLHGAALALLYI